MSAPLPETVALVRRRYSDGAALTAIQAETGIRKIGTLYACIDGKYDDGSGTMPQALPRRRLVVRRVRATRESRRASLTLRLWRAAERQVQEIEQRLTFAHQEATERERDARVLSVLVKTLRDLAAFDADQPGKTPADAHDGNDDFPRDIDDLRRELSRRLDAMAATDAD